MINIRVDDEYRFFNNIYDYLVEKTKDHLLNISHFSQCGIDETVEDRALACYPIDAQSGQQKKIFEYEWFDCPLYDLGLHVHNIEYGRNFANDTVTHTKELRYEPYANCPLVFCSRLEVSVVNFINQQLTLTPTLKKHFIFTLHEWLPACTFDSVKLTMRDRRSSHNIQVHSYFEPTFVTARYNIDISGGNCGRSRPPLDYYYYETSNYMQEYNIVYPQKSIYTCGEVTCYRIGNNGGNCRNGRSSRVRRNEKTTRASA